MPITVQIVNPEDTLEIQRQKINSNDGALQNQGNSLESQQAAHVAAGHPTLYYSKAEVDAAITAVISAAQGYKEFVAHISQVGASAPTVQVFGDSIGVGNNISMSYSLPGRYILSVGKEMFTIGKTFCLVGGNERPGSITMQPADDLLISIKTQDVNGNYADSVLAVSFIIRVYE